MPLCIPRITHPVSEWSTTLVIEGALPGARVIVRIGGATGPVAADASAAGGLDVMTLLPGVQLKAGQVLVLQQTSGGQASAWTHTDLGAVVGAPPTHHDQLAAPAFVSRLFDFSRRIWVAGTVPGAHVEIAEGMAVIGTGTAAPEGARLALTSVMRANQTIKATQRAPAGFPPLGGTPKAAHARVQGLPVPMGQPLPQPVVAGTEPVGCDPAVPIGNIVDGATVTIARVTEGSTESAEFDAERLWFVLSKPLDPAGGVIEVTQAFDTQRETLPSTPLSVRFAPAPYPPQPAIAPLCSGSRAITLHDLAPGAIVTITVVPPHVSSSTYRGMVPPTTSTTTFEIDPLPLQAEVSVWQERCELRSIAAWATVSERGELAPIELKGPLYDCARVVRVVGAHTGARLRVWSEDPDGKRRIIGEHAAAAETSVQIAVAPFLAQGQHVWVEQYPCGGPWAGTARAVVVAAPALFPPTVRVPPILGSRVVTVDAIPGAYVEVYIEREDGRWERVGAGCVDSEDFRVPLVRPLGREPVFATQALCGQVSRRGPAAEVKPNERTFTLPKAKKRPVVSKDVEWQSATLTVRHDGSWQFNISVENKDTKGDVDMDLQVGLGISNPKFQTVITCALGSPGNDVGFRYGRANLGFPAADSKTRTGSFPAFTDPTYWLDVLTTTAKFEWFVAVTDYSLPKPKSEEKKPSGSSSGK